MRGHTDAARAYWRLRDMIVRTELAPGAALFESDLMQQLDVGRTPLRDALQRLSHERLVEILPRRGTFVTEVTVSDLQQVFEVAWALDDVLSRRVVERCTDADLVELVRLTEKQAAVPVEHGSTVEIDNQLHRLLLRVAGNEYLAEAYQHYRDASLRLLYLTRCGRESHAEQQDFLLAVAGALAERDAVHLADLIRNRRQRFRDRLASSVFSPSRGLAAQAS